MPAGVKEVLNNQSAACYELSLVRNEKLVAGVDFVRIGDVVDFAEGLYSGAVALCNHREAVTLLDDVDEAGTGVSIAFTIVINKAAVYFHDFIFIQSFKIC